MELLGLAAAEIDSLGAPVDGTIVLEGLENAINEFAGTLSGADSETLGRVRNNLRNAMNNNIKPKQQPRSGGQQPKSDGSVSKAVINAYKDDSSVLSKLPLEMRGMSAEAKSAFTAGFTNQEIYCNKDIAGQSTVTMFAMAEGKEIGLSNVDKGRLDIGHYMLVDTVILEYGEFDPATEKVATCDFGTKQLPSIIRNGNIELGQTGLVLLQDVSVKMLKETRNEGGRYEYRHKLVKPILILPQKSIECKVHFAGAAKKETTAYAALSLRFAGVETCENSQKLK